MTYAQWFNAGGFNETGYPFFSGNVDSDATFYRVNDVSGFPVPNTCRCACPYLEDQTSLGSSFVAMKTNAVGAAKIWISACAMGQCSDPVLGLYKWYWQIRYFSGDSSAPASLQIGAIPIDRNYRTNEDFAPDGAVKFGGPSITAQPQDQTVALGGNAAFSVTVTGPGQLTYQWFFNGIDLIDTSDTHIRGSQTATLQINNVTADDVGSYYVTVTADPYGSTESAKANLKLPGAPTIKSVITKYSPNGEALYVVNGISFPMTLTANVDWAGQQPGSVLFMTPQAGTFKVSAVSDKVDSPQIDVGTAFGVGGQLQVQAVSNDGTTRSASMQAALVVMPPVPGFEGLFELEDHGTAFEYTMTGSKLIPLFDILPGDLPTTDFPGWGGDSFELKDEVEVKGGAQFTPSIKGNHADLLNFSLGAGQAYFTNPVDLTANAPILSFSKGHDLSAGLVVKTFYDYQSSQKAWALGGSLGVQLSTFA